MFIKVSMVLIFFAITIGIGAYFRKRTSSVNDFVLGGRAVGPWLTAFSYGTTYFSAVVFVGYAGQFGWKFGTAAVWIGLGNAFVGSLLPWVIIGKRTRVMTNHLKSATMPEFFGARYVSSALKIAAALIVFVFLIPYTASLYNGLSRLFEMAFGIDFIYCIIAMAVLTAVYVVLGGYFGSAVNDFIQGLVMIVGIVAVIATVLKDNGGFIDASAGLAAVQGANVKGAVVPGVFTSFFGPDPMALLGVVLLTSLGTWGLPQMVARFYSIKSEKVIFKGAVISTIFALIIAGGCYFLGSFSNLYSKSVEYTVEGTLNDGIAVGGTIETLLEENKLVLTDNVIKGNVSGTIIEDLNVSGSNITGVLDGIDIKGKVIYDSIIPNILSKFSDLLIGLIILLVFAASISTLSSLVLVSSSTLTLDFIKGNLVKKMSDKKQLLIIRALIVVFIIISAAIAILQYQKNLIFIAQMMGISWGALAGSFLAPFLYGLYWKKATKLSVWCCFIFSTVVMTSNVILNLFFNDIFLKVFPKILQSSINCGAFVMLAGLIIVPVVSMFSKAPDKASLDSSFACYDK